jgi:hypothetical protein
VLGVQIGGVDYDTYRFHPSPLGGSVSYQWCWVMSKQRRQHLECTPSPLMSSDMSPETGDVTHAHGNAARAEELAEAVLSTMLLMFAILE